MLLSDTDLRNLKRSLQSKTPDTQGIIKKLFMHIDAMNPANAAAAAAAAAAKPAPKKAPAKKAPAKKAPAKKAPAKKKTAAKKK